MWNLIHSAHLTSVSALQVPTYKLKAQCTLFRDPNAANSNLELVWKRRWERYGGCSGGDGMEIPPKVVTDAAQTLYLVSDI